MHLLVRAPSLFGAVALAVILSACSGAKPAIRQEAPSLTAERPKDEAFRTALRPELSVLNLTVETTAADVARTLNQAVGKELYKGSANIGSGVTAVVVKNGAIAVSAAADYIHITVPVAMSLSYGMFETRAIPLKLKFKAAAKVTSDWKVNAELHYTGISDLMAEDAGIGPISFKPRKIVDGIMQPLQKSLSELVSRKLNESFPLRPRVAEAWNAAQKPILLDKGYSAWLRVTPQEVTLYPLTARKDKIALSLGLTSYAEVVVGPQPQQRPPVPLPNLKLAGGGDRNFKVAVNTDLYYKDILAIASPLLLNKEFASDGRSITVKGFDLYGNGDKLVVRVDTVGSLDGTFYLTCKPSFDPKTNRFSVDDVDFDMQTKSLLLSTADWFLHGTIRDSIRERLNVDLTQRMEQGRDMARKALTQVQVMDHLFLTGDVKTFRFNDAMVQKDRISIQLYSEGETSLVFR